VRASCHPRSSAIRAKTSSPQMQTRPNDGVVRFQRQLVTDVPTPRYRSAPHDRLAQPSTTGSWPGPPRPWPGPPQGTSHQIAQFVSQHAIRGFWGGFMQGEDGGTG
jgi:hypothetical protein